MTWANTVRECLEGEGWCEFHNRTIFTLRIFLPRKDGTTNSIFQKKKVNFLCLFLVEQLKNKRMVWCILPMYFHIMWFFITRLVYGKEKFTPIHPIPTHLYVGDSHEILCSLGKKNYKNTCIVIPILDRQSRLLKPLT